MGAVVLILEWFRLGFYDKTSGGIGWVWFPYQLCMNGAHTIGFVVGVIVALIICITKVQSQNKDGNLSIDKTNQNLKTAKASRGFAIFMILAIVIAWVWLPIYLYGQSKREYIVKFEIDCNIDEYDCVFDMNEMGVSTCTNKDVVQYWLKKFNLNYDLGDYNSSEISAFDRIHGGKVIFFATSSGSPTYLDPEGTGDYLGGDYLFTITLQD